jgi:hypothetical protein
VADWPALSAARTPAAFADYVSRFDNGRPVETFVGAASIKGRFFYLDDMRGLNFERRQIPLKATLSHLMTLVDDPAPIAIYAGAVDVGHYAPGFQAENDLPLVEDVPARLWIGNATRIATHYDLSANVACVVRGRRRFTLFPPEQAPNLYVGPLDFTMAGQPSSMVDLDDPDFDRYPRFRTALEHARVADLEPGDAIFIPTLWWHNVRAFDPFSVLVNFWWGPPEEASPFESLVHAILAIRDLPESERDAWQKVFGYYVFSGGGETTAHLPDHAKGILGPPSAARGQKIRTFLLNALARREQMGQRS